MPHTVVVSLHPGFRSASMCTAAAATVAAARGVQGSCFVLIILLLSAVACCCSVCLWCAAVKGGGASWVAQYHVGECCVLAWSGYACVHTGVSMIAELYTYWDPLSVLLPVLYVSRSHLCGAVCVVGCVWVKYCVESYLAAKPHGCGCLEWTAGCFLLAAAD